MIDRTWQLGRDDGPTIEFSFTAPARMPPPAFERLRRLLELLEQEYALDWPAGSRTPSSPPAEPARRSPKGAVSRAAEVERFVLAAAREVTCREVCDATGEKGASITRSALMRLVGQGRLRKVGSRFAPPANEPPKQVVPEEDPDPEPAPDTARGYVENREAGLVEEEADAPVKYAGRHLPPPADIPVIDDEDEAAVEEEDEEPKRPAIDLARTGPTKKRCAACKAEKPRSAFAGPASSLCRTCTRLGKRPAPRPAGKKPVLVCTVEGCETWVGTEHLVLHMLQAHGRALQARAALAFFRVPPTRT